MLLQLRMLEGVYHTNIFCATVRKQKSSYTRSTHHPELMLFSDTTGCGTLVRTVVLASSQGYTGIKLFRGYDEAMTFPRG